MLKPGGLFAFSDWTMTDKFDAGNPEHLKIRNWMEFGNGITKMPLVQEIRDGLKETGEFSVQVFQRLWLTKSRI